MKQTRGASRRAAAGVVVFMACASPAHGAETPSLDGTAWVLSSLPGQAHRELPSATARFEGGRAQGSDGCNHYSAPYSTKGSALEIGPGGASTQMACSNMKQAAAFTEALYGARRYRVRHGQLQLLAADGSVLSTFVAQPTGLADTSWHATGINNGKGGVASLVADSTVTMDFAPDGKVAGSAGCNTYTSSYQTHGDRLRFTPAAATRRMCTASGVLEQEQAFFQALASVAAMRREGDRLEMRTAAGALALSLVRATGP